VTYERLQQCREDADAFLQQVIEAHRQDFADQMAAWEKSITDERKKRLRKRAEERKRQRKAEYEAKKAEEARELQERTEREKLEATRARYGGGTRGDDARIQQTRISEEPSKADEDYNWRKATTPQRVESITELPPPTIPHNGPPVVAPPPPRDGFKRINPTPVASEGDKESQWRAAPRQQPATIERQPQQPREDRDRGFRRDGPPTGGERDFGDLRNRREPPAPQRREEPPRADQGVWRRPAAAAAAPDASVPSRGPMSDASNTGNAGDGWREKKGGAAQPQAEAKPKKYQPPHLRGAQS
jgi:hypothetical protein